MTDLEQILSKLKGVKRNGNGWLACCPAHKDDSPSLSITESGGKLLLHCFAGCGFSDILAAVGMKGNRPPPSRPFRLVPPPQRKPLTFLDDMWAQWAHGTDWLAFGNFAIQLGVDEVALRSTGCCWAWPYDCWGFPMHDADGEFTGMRLRTADNKKLSVPGGREGLFLLDGLPREPFCIVEGPTDLAALATLSFSGCGRPSCQGAVEMTAKYCRKWQVTPVILADNDGPGIEGARELQKAIVGSRLAMLPAKDTREFLKLGGTKDMYLTCINNALEKGHE